MKIQRKGNKLNMVTFESVCGPGLASALQRKCSFTDIAK